MLMVIFGAGASYDSDPDQRPLSSRDEEAIIYGANVGVDRPPLAAQLFDRQRFGMIAQQYRHCHALFQPLREADNIEEELERMRQLAVSKPYYNEQLFELRHYLRHVMYDINTRWTGATNNITNYVTTFRIIHDWCQDQQERACLVTFNYDTLLDQAMFGILRRPFDEMSAYIDLPTYNQTGTIPTIINPYSLIKLHGSINWLRLVKNVRNNNPSANISSLAWTDTYAVRDDFQIGPLQGPESGTSYVPAIAIPTVTKSQSQFECPRDHLKRLRDSIPLVTHLLTIGWRGREQHFLDLWKEIQRRTGEGSFQPRLGRIQIVAGSEAGTKEVQENLANDGGIACEDVRYATGGFTQFLKSGELHRFLYD